MRTVVVGMAAVLALGVMSAAQTPVPREQPLVIKSMAGADLFKFYCSTCHGEDARGGRAAAPERPAGPDLTILARRNGGVFPRAYVLEVIRHGSGSPASHGPGGMPVWGAIFRGLDSNDTRTEIRIENLVEYLTSLQDHAVAFGR
jgi:mono/diheme cytochrome c family protein